MNITRHHFIMETIIKRRQEELFFGCVHDKLLLMKFVGTD